MSDTPLKRSTRRTTSVRRTIETTTRRTTTPGPVGATSVNIATAFKLSGLSDSAGDSDDSSQNLHVAIDNTPVPIRNHEETDTEEEISDKHSETESEEEETFNTPLSSGLGRRLLSTILPYSPQWIRAATPQREASPESDSHSESESENNNQTVIPQSKKTRSAGLVRNPEPPGTVNLVAGRYYLRPRVNSPARSVARAPTQLQEHAMSSSDDEEWSPKPTFYEPTSLSKLDTNHKLDDKFQNYHEDSEEPSSDEYSYSESDSGDEYPEVIKIPIWRPIQAAIVGCFAGVGQIVKSILSAIGFLIFMVFWILKEIISTLFVYTKYILLTLFVTPVRSLLTSGHVVNVINAGTRGFKGVFRCLTKNLGWVLFVSAISGLLWANLHGQNHEEMFNNLRERLDHHKYLEKIPKFDTSKLKLPEISIPEISLPEISLPEISIPEISLPDISLPDISLPDISLPAFEIKLPSWDSLGWPKHSNEDSDSSSDYTATPEKPQVAPKDSDENVVISHPEGSDISLESFDELQSRLESLEISLRHLSFVANSLVDHNDVLREAAGDEVVYQNSVNNEVDSLKNLFDEHIKHTRDQKETVDSILESIKNSDHKLEGFNSDIESLRSQINSAESKMNSLGANITSAYNDLERMKERIIEISQHDYYSRQILDTVERALPNYLIASKNRETGSVEVAPEFYQYLKSLFVTPVQLQSMVQEGLVRSDQPDLPPWSEFLEANQKELHSLIRENIAKSVNDMNDSGVAISKKDFLYVLQKKLDDLKEQIASKIQEEVNSVAEKFEQKSKLYSDLESPLLFENTDTISLVSNLIDDALAKYSADILGLPDYALYSGGGRVIPSLTSVSYHVPSKSMIARAAAKVFGLSALGSGNPPTTALNPDIHLGKCWPFPGNQGNLTVLLSRSIIPTDFSIEHVPRSVAIDVSSAPKKLAVYGLYEKTDDMPKEIDGELLEHEGKIYVQQFLSTYEYDVNSSRHVQTFPVQAQIKLSQPVRIVQLRVLSNYGQDTYTCLYRFRVHGKIAE
ncbi:hypothetical protein K7432_012638 [Basidiobolus ranarum]|uniref:SUN domain-containing protein n=1 Tax=Basidiobolus ranarum TaxID=34480 RepID=A0ABR2VRY8_9FUNG